MRYNVIKTKEDYGFLEYIAKGKSETEAITILYEERDRELSRIAQDVDEIEETSGLAYFKVTNNHVVYTYRIEEDMFWKMAQLSKPENRILNDFFLN